MWAEEARMDVIRLIASDLDATLLDDQSQLCLLYTSEIFYI